MEHALCRKYAIFIIVVCMLICQQGKAQLWRVAEDIYQKYDNTAMVFMTIDSTKYSYHPNYGRGSSPENDTIKYDKRKKYRVEATGAQQIEDFQQKFYPDGEIQVTIRQVLDTITNKWSLQGMDSFTKTGKWLELYMLYELLHTGTTYSMYATKRKIYNYTLSGALTRVMEQKSYAFSHVWTNHAMSGYAYDNGKLIADTIYATGINNAWKLNCIYQYDYDGSGLLRSAVFAYFKTGGLDTISGTFYSYNTQGQVDTATIKNYQGNGLWTPTAHIKYTYHAGGEIHADTTFGVGSIMPYIKANRYLYNIAGHITEWQQEIYGEPKERHIYNYEHYWPAGIATSQASAQNITIYPVPTSGILNIQGKFDKVSDIQMVITDVQGRIMLQISDKAAGNYTKHIPISNLVPGNYFIGFNSGIENVVRQFQVR